jgi:hypothetical protein
MYHCSYSIIPIIHHGAVHTHAPKPKFLNPYDPSVCTKRWPQTHSLVRRICSADDKMTCIACTSLYFVNSVYAAMWTQHRYFPTPWRIYLVTQTPKMIMISQEGCLETNVPWGLSWANFKRGLSMNQRKHLNMFLFEKCLWSMENMFMESAIFRDRTLLLT